MQVKIRYTVVRFKDLPFVNKASESWIVEEENKYYVWWPKSALKVGYSIQNREAEQPNANTFDRVEIEAPDNYYGKNNNLNEIIVRWLFIFVEDLMFLFII